MQRVIFVLLSVWVLLICVNSIARSEDLSKGFGGIEWGSKITSQRGLKAIGQKKDVTYYQNPRKKYDFDGEPLKRVVYGFFNKSLFAAYIDIDTLELFAKIKGKLQSSFGDYKKSTSLKHDLTEYRWTHKDVKIKLKQWGKSNKMKVAFYFMPLLRQVNEDEQERYQEKTIRYVPIELDKKPERWILFEW